MENNTQVIDAEVSSSEGSEKKIMLLNDGHNYNVTSTKAETIAGLVQDLNLDPTQIVVKAGNSAVVDFDNTPVQDNEFYSIISRNKTGG
tara:strand:+ start:183 stop:449 length:267 start_codon:yes stop_codon:yes gene_type:complete